MRYAYAGPCLLLASATLSFAVTKSSSGDPITNFDTQTLDKLKFARKKIMSMSDFDDKAREVKTKFDMSFAADQVGSEISMSTKSPEVLAMQKDLSELMTKHEIQRALLIKAQGEYALQQATATNLKNVLQEKMMAHTDASKPAEGPGELIDWNAMGEKSVAAQERANKLKGWADEVELKFKAVDVEINTKIRELEVHGIKTANRVTGVNDVEKGFQLPDPKGGLVNRKGMENGDLQIHAKEDVQQDISKSVESEKLAKMENELMDKLVKYETDVGTFKKATEEFKVLKKTAVDAEKKWHQQMSDHKLLESHADQAREYRDALNVKASGAESHRVSEQAEKAGEKVKDMKKRLKSAKAEIRSRITELEAHGGILDGKYSPEEFDESNSGSDSKKNDPLDGKKDDNVEPEVKNNEEESLEEQIKDAGGVGGDDKLAAGSKNNGGGKSNEEFDYVDEYDTSVQESGIQSVDKHGPVSKSNSKNIKLGNAEENQLKNQLEKKFDDSVNIKDGDVKFGGQEWIDIKANLIAKGKGAMSLGKKVAIGGTIAVVALIFVGVFYCLYGGDCSSIGIERKSTVPLPHSMEDDIIKNAESPKAVMKARCDVLNAVAARVEGIAEDTIPGNGFEFALESLAPVFDQAYLQASQFGNKNLTDHVSEYWDHDTTSPPLFIPVHTSESDKLWLMEQYNQTQAMERYLRPIYIKFHFAQQHHEKIHDLALGIMLQSDSLRFDTKSDQFNRAYTAIHSRLLIPPPCHSLISEGKSVFNRMAPFRANQALQMIDTNVALETHFVNSGL